MPELIVEKLFKRFGDVVAVDHISFTVKDGEFLTLLGPSGCGKSTTLFSIAGLHRPDGGFIRCGEKTFFDSNVNGYLVPEKRNCGMVFQSYAIWPHMTVYGNLAFPLKLRKVPKQQMNARIHETLELVELDAYQDRYPHQLSGGQQQRVALARALVYSPLILLLDEPLSNLDAKLRDRARSWIKRIQEQLGITTVYVTHDQVEALALSDRIAVMRDGQICQIGTPYAIYAEPVSPFVADFIGRSNFGHGRVVATDDKENVTVHLDDADHNIQVRTGKSFAPETPVTVSIRVENVVVLDHDGQQEPGVENAMRAEIDEHTYLGSHYQYRMRVNQMSVLLQTRKELAAETVWLQFPSDNCVIFKTD